MYVKVNGTRLFFDVVGSSLQPVGEEMKPKPIVIALHGGPGLDHSYLRPLDPLGDVAQVIYQLRVIPYDATSMIKTSK